MKKLIYIIGGLLTMGACTLPDVKKANPPVLLDAAAFNVTPTGDNQAVANGKLGYDGKTIGTSYLVYGTSTDFAIDVTDAPGKVSDVTVSISVPDYITTANSPAVPVDASTLAALKGKTTGSTKATVSIMADPDGVDRSCNLVFNVADSQKDVEAGGAPKTASLTWPTVLVKCIGTGIATGKYRVTAASGIGDGTDGSYTLADLEADYGGPVVITITSTRPGLYTLSEASGGFMYDWYLSTRPALSVDLCNTTVSGHTGAVTSSGKPVVTGSYIFTLNGTLNSDGTISMTWSYVRAAGGTPSPAANGTYTLTKI